MADKLRSAVVVWPIVDDGLTLSELADEARAELPGVLESCGWRQEGEPSGFGLAGAGRYVTCTVPVTVVDPAARSGAATADAIASLVADCARVPRGARRGARR